MDYRISGYLVLLVICTVFAVPQQKKIISTVNAVSIHRNETNFLEAPKPKQQYPEVSLKINNLTATLDNGFIKITFENDATVSSLYKNGQNLVQNVNHHSTFYLDWHSGTFNKFSPDSLQVVSQSAEHAHIMYLQDSPGYLKLEYHLIIRQGLNGLYTYIKATNNQDHLLSFAELRVIYRFNPKVMHQVTNSVREGILPHGKELTNARLVQDATWQLSDGTYYSKYDYAGYIRNSPYLGVFGHGYGAWMISASRDYHSGGPLKQDILVHDASLISNYMTGGHFGTPDMKTPVGWSKIYGPWLMYFNEGSDEEMKKDVIHQTKVEQDLWPYKWMNELDYPLKRGVLKGKVTTPVRSMIVLSSSLAEEFDLQTLGFSYSTESDENGDFQLENIRPGKYKLTSYPIEGYGIGVQSEKFVTITEGTSRVTLDLSIPTEVKWSIGETNRRSDSYRYSNETRNYIWHTLPPADLEFEIGKNDIHTDWYYAQTKRGTWSIKYQDSANGKKRILRIGIAAASNIAPSAPGAPGFPILAVFVNGYLINEFNYESDKSIYRSALQSGNYHAETIIFPGSLVTEGDNLISLTLFQGCVMYDSINLSDEKDY